jgi:hypothetical protein
MVMNLGLLKRADISLSFLPAMSFSGRTLLLGVRQ